MHYYISIGPGACNLEPSLECMQCHILVVDFILNLSVNFVSYYHRIKIYSHKFTAQNHAIDFYDWAKKVSGTIKRDTLSVYRKNHLNPIKDKAKR